MPVATVANFSARGVLSVSASRGVDVGRLIRESGLDEKSLESPGTHVPLEGVIKLWEQARRSTRDENLPLHVAEFLPVGTYKTWDLFLATAPTVGDALDKIAKFNGWMDDTFRLTRRTHRDRLSLEYTNVVDPECQPPEYLEFNFARALLRARFTTGMNIRPAEMHFRHSPPKNTAAYARIFQAPIRFRQPATRAIFDPAVLRIPQLSADAATCELLEHYIQATLSNARVYDELAVAVRRSLARLQSSHATTLAATARELGMSRRGLQRRLAERGMSFREFFRSVRYDLALTLLSRRDLSIGEAADLLGFSEVSSFSRAFKRWTGTSPQAHRHQLRKAPAGPAGRWRGQSSV
jgi:AraC-like DNA-binding protein